MGVAVEEAGTDELVEDADDKGREEGEEDVVRGEGPGFVDDFAGEAVLEGVLEDDALVANTLIQDLRGRRAGTYPKLGHEHGNVLVERIQDDLAHAVVAPCAMHQQKLAKETKLADCNVSTSRGL